MRTGSGNTLPEAISTFEADGVVCLRCVIARDQIDDLAKGIDDIVCRLHTSSAGYDMSSLRKQIFESTAELRTLGSANQHDLDGLSALLRNVRAVPLLDKTSEVSDGRFMIDTSTWLRSGAVRRLALDSMLPAIAAELLHATRINFLDDQVFVKEPRTAERTAFHQDYTYFHVEGWMGCVMWICVDHASRDSGAPVYVRGSHRWGRNFRPNVFLAQASLPGSEGDDLSHIEEHPEDYDLIRYETAPGDVIIHHYRTIHGAGGNRTRAPRRAVSLRYCGDDVRFCERPGAPRQPYHKHALQEGDRLDCEQFPVVWPKPFPGFALAPIIEARMG